MKRIILLCLASLVAALTIVQAQESANLPRTLILGGTFGLSISENSNNPFISSSVTNGVVIQEVNENKYRSFSLNPYLGSQVSPHWIVGGRGTFLISNNEFDLARFFNPVTGTFDAVKQIRRTTIYGVGAFGRYTFNPDRQVNLFVQNAIDYTVGTERLEIDNIEEGNEKYNSFRVSVTPGINWKVADNFSLLGSIGLLSYEAGKWEDELEDLDQSFSDFDLSLNFSTFRFGIEFRL